MLFTFRLRNILIWQISSREKIVYLILVFSQTLIYTSIKYCDNNMYFSVANEFTFHCFSEWTEIFIFLLKKERTLFRVHIQKTQYSPTWLLKKCHSKKKKKKVEACVNYLWKQYISSWLEANSSYSKCLTQLILYFSNKLISKMWNY